MSLPVFGVSGSIVCIQMHCFMQYTDAKFNPGPNLNVILGPNGSGKSTIVNAICLGVGGKPIFLGRGDTIQSFIQNGKDSAWIELELFNADGDNYIINRKFGQDGKSEWTINGKSSNQKSIETLAKKLQIQVGNLCQFLPQQKVHDFSKLNSKELMDKTIDAIGKISLKEIHHELKENQKMLAKDTEEVGARKLTLDRDVERLQSMEGDVQNFVEKQRIDNAIDDLEKLKSWKKYLVQKSILIALNKEKNALKKELEDKSSILEPLKQTLEELRSKRESVIFSIRKKEEKCGNSSLGKTLSKLETLKEEYSSLGARVETVIKESEERDLKIKKMEKEIQHSQNEYDKEVEKTPFNVLEEEKSKLDVELDSFGDKESEIKETDQKLSFERSKLERDISSKTHELNRLQDEKEAKLNKLMELSHDAYKAVKIWRDAEIECPSTKGRVFEPILLNIEIKSPSLAIYIENTIPHRDMVSFCTENSEDTKTLLNFFREKQGLSVNVITLDPSKSLSNFQSNISPSQLPKSSDFKTYLVDAFEAPESIKVVLCSMFNIQNTAIFGEKGKSSANTIVDKLALFFFGNLRYSVIRSKYSGKTSTNTNAVSSRGWFVASVDEVRIRSVEKEISEYSETSKQIMAKLRESNGKLKEIQKFKEETLMKAKENNQRLAFLKKLQKTAINNTKRLEAFKDKPFETLESVHLSIKTHKIRIVKDVLRINKELQKSMKISGEAKITYELEKLKERPIVLAMRAQESEIKEAKSGLKELESRKSQKEAEFDEQNKKADESVRDFRNRCGLGSGVMKPTEALIESWNKLPQDVVNEETDVSAKLDAEVDRLKGRSACLGNVSREFIQEYDSLKASVSNLQETLTNHEEKKRKKEAYIESLKDKWLKGLNSMVLSINGKFESYFAFMGYAGQVVVHEGKTPSDFDNYGLDIYVKYRPNVEMSKLDRYTQSGGERSVATALYMMALQELTKVPFRCVDEINQGMDSANERKVFDLLVRTSCHENSAQYFLLTPKLLSNLNYSDRMKIHVVNNGSNMCPHHKWSIGKFIERSERGYSQAA